MQKKKLINIFVIIIVIAVVAVAGFLVESNATVDCKTCGGAGERITLVCHDCEGTGKIDDETCIACEGKGGLGDMIECADCEGAGQVASGSNYYATFVSLIPPIIAIALALITKEVYSSLFIGVLTAGLFAANFKPIAVVDSMVNDGIVSAVTGTAGIFIFLVLLGTLAALVNKAGGSAAFGRWAKVHIKSKVGASIATFILGVLIFIDDYFNCLTVGSVMRPVTDKHKISRAKLAYLIDATAAPVCMIAPISSWAAAVSNNVGEGKDGFALFIKAIPYNFYSLLTFVFILGITFMKFDFGPMKLHELNASKGDLFTSGKGESLEEEEGSAKGRVIDLILPIVLLIITCVFALVYVGGIFAGKSFVTAFGDTDAYKALPWGALVALVFIIVYLIARKTISFKDAMDCIPKGFKAMVPAILILTLATALKNITKILGSDAFVEDMLASAGALHSFLPAIIFLVAVGISFATGTSWGTFGILIPIVMVLPLGNELGIIAMSACLAGSVCGDHCSPISDTTIMSSAGAQCNHLNHVSTQLPYALTVAGISFVMYIVAGFVQNWMIVLPVGIVLTLVVLAVIKSMTKKAQ